MEVARISDADVRVIFPLLHISMVNGRSDELTTPDKLAFERRLHSRQRVRK